MEVPTSVPLKNLEWAKVQPRMVHSSFWVSAVDEAYGHDSEASFANTLLDARELATLPSIFSKSEESVQVSMVPHSKKVVLLDKNRSQHIEILLASLRGPDLNRLTRQQIRDGILHISDTVLTMDNLTMLIQMVPTDSEIDLVNSFKGDVESLANAEKFLRTMSTIPRLKSRLECIIFEKRFVEEASEIKPDLTALSKATQALMTSTRFRKVLQAVLVIGNFVNNNTWRGGAYGFEMGSLLKLKETKAVEESELKDRAPTLLHYLARRLEEVDEELIDLKAEIGAAEFASRVAIDILFSSVQDLKSGFNDIRSEISVLEQLGPTPTDTSFLHNMRQFVSTNDPKLARLITLADSVQTELQTLFTHFGQDPHAYKDVGREQLFKTIWSFQESLVRAHSENRVADEKALRVDSTVNPYSRVPVLTPLQMSVKEKRERLKAVEGMEAFSKRGLTVRRGRKAPLLGGGEEEDIGAVGVAMAAEETSALKQAVQSRTTLRRLAKRVSVVNSMRVNRVEVGEEEGEEVIIDGVLSTYA
ncbi:hypothetical protein HDU98_003626 [Podochytrium sp. JEL0797]|nr:hypothetical protein HDU98_003626 [Podochytrium sp. JEL0797]